MAKPPEPLPPEVLAAFKRRQPIEAIKLLLASQAQAVQGTKSPSLQQPTRPTKSQPKASRLPSVEAIASGRELSPGEVPRSRIKVWTWVAVALLVYVAYRLARA